jgi:antitoxin component YwqK of YwqJK toxin-antitoxin module
MKKEIILIICCFLSLLACQHNADIKEKKMQEDSLTTNKQKNDKGVFKPDNTVTGAYEDKYPDGKTKTMGDYRFGRKHGIWSAFYPSGIIWSENTYVNDTLNGETTTYYEDGKTRYKGFYTKNQPSGLWQFYDTTGKVIQEKKY